VAATPIEANPTAPTNDLDPPGDFRGSPAYRTHLAAVLSARALTEMD
jgi:CO/xanthine dehydrogenase FAD-binding subunit